MNKHLRWLVIVATTIINQNAFSQCVPLPTIDLQNPSFEGVPQPHVTPGPWSICMFGQTPDTQPGSWGITLPPTNGSSYLGMVHQPSTGWQEGAAQQLTTPLVAGSTYTFTIDLANVQNAMAGVGILPGCAELQIWGGYSDCDRNSLLWTSGDITTFDTWITYTVTLTPSQNFTWIMFQINSLGCTDGPYILLDNIGTITPNSFTLSPTIIAATCFGSNTGSAYIGYNNGQAPYTFLWSDGTTTQNHSNMFAGTYGVTVTDGNACTVSTTITVTEPPVLSVSCAASNPSCSASGSATATPSGGTSGYSYAWNTIPAQNTATATNLLTGTYIVTVTDANSCTASSSVSISQPPPLTLTGTTVDPTCNSPGSVTANPGGGTPGYTFAWNTTPSQTAATATNLGGGTYIVTVTDASSCTITGSFTLTPPPNTPSVSLTPTSINCFGQSTGSISSAVSGGSPGYTYSWNTTPVQNTSTATNLAAGSYSVTVTDASTCTASANATITEPTALTVTTTVTNVLCFGQSTGSALSNPTGGTGTYTYLWNTTPPQSTPASVNLTAGNYTVAVTDANGCTASAPATVNQPASALSLTESNTDVLCFGANTGSANVNASGGTPGYSFSWNTSPVQTTASISSLVAGTYTVVVTDTNNCSASISAVITEPASAVTVTTSTITPLCFGQANGASATATGGTGAYSYSWNTIPVQNTPSISNVAAGTYTVTATDANGCTATSNANISAAPSQVTVSTTAIDVLCFGQSTGSVTATPAGGTGGYTYLWNTNPVQTTATASNLPASIYNVTVSDANSCTASANATVNQPATAVAVSETHIDVLCFGDNTGSATVSASGGTGGYTYAWNTTPTQTSATASVLQAGTYTVTVTDANNCTSTISSVVSQPSSPVNATTSLTSPTCFGQPLASATATGSGGVPNYSYSWNTVPVQNTQTVSNIPPGSYTVTATDANNCTATASITVSPPPTQLVISMSHTDVLCFGAATGSITANASGSYGNYSYNWSATPVQTTATASQLLAGSYTVTVTDMQGCSATASDNISQPASALSIVTSKTDILCFGDVTGTATVSASGGTPGYTYAWNTTPQQNTALISSLVAGTYNVTVTDANACQLTGTETISQPTQLAATSSLVNVDCNGSNNGSITLSASGGVAAYSYQWSAVPSPNAPTASGLAPGNYSATITDANNCTMALSNMMVTEPTALALSTPLITDVSCPNQNDGSIDVTVSGGTSPYAYSWSNGSNTVPNSNLAGGTYNLTVTDANGCTVAATNIVVIELPGVLMTAIVTNIPCAEVQNGSIDVSATSSFLPLQYQWNTGEVTEDLSALNTDTYSVTVTDQHNCTADSTFVVGNDNVFTMDATPSVVTINLGESVNLDVTALTGILSTAVWTPSTGLNCSDCFNPVSSAVESITYYVDGTDVNGCKADDSVRVMVVPIYNIFIPNAFTPNGDGFNDFFEVMGNKEAWKQFEVKLFNRWGEKVYESNDMDFKWDGVFKSRMLEPTVLVYTIKLVYLDNYTEKIHKGTVTLIR